MQTCLLYITRPCLFIWHCNAGLAMWVAVIWVTHVSYFPNLVSIHQKKVDYMAVRFLCYLWYQITWTGFQRIWEDVWWIIYMFPLLLLCCSTNHYNDIIMSTMASQITSLTIVYLAVYSGADQTKISKLRVTGLCAGNSPVAGEFPAHRASNAENVYILWRHHALTLSITFVVASLPLRQFYHCPRIGVIVKYNPRKRKCYVYNGIFLT